MSKVKKTNFSIKVNPLIGFVGVGWIGSSYSNDFERRGYNVVKYSLDKKYKKNKLKIGICDYVFVAVPTPSTPDGFDDSILIDAIKSCTVDGQTIIIKSTVIVGTTEKIQKMFPKRYIIHSPEFLTEATAAYDVAKPDRNLLGYTDKSLVKCGEVMSLLPQAPYEKITKCNETELVKYMSNCWFYAKVMMMNIFYDIAETNKVDFDSTVNMLSADGRVGRTHLNIFHKKGRGAGGHCFIKDMVALREMYELTLNNGVSRDKNNLGHSLEGFYFLLAMEDLNKKLLNETKKDLDLLKMVYGRI